MSQEWSVTVRSGERALANSGRPAEARPVLPRRPELPRRGGGGPAGFWWIWPGWVPGADGRWLRTQADWSCQSLAITAQRSLW